MHLDHVALATRDAGAPLRTLAGELGATILSGGHSIGFRPMQVFMGDASGGMKIELLEPWEHERNDFLERFLVRHGEGPHHLTFKVDDLVAAIARVEAAGCSPIGVDLTEPIWREAFIAPAEAHGTVVQLAESNASLKLPLDEYEWAREHGPSGEPVWWPPVERGGGPTILRRVVLATPDLDATRAFFGGLLQGEVADEGEAWVELGWASGARLRLEASADGVRGIDRLELDGAEPRDLVVAGARLVVR
jgi:catechol 2,3-dioxygenase-like lactoylglutathione lyase family enzyme